MRFKFLKSLSFALLLTGLSTAHSIELSFEDQLREALHSWSRCAALYVGEDRPVTHSCHGQIQRSQALPLTDGIYTPLWSGKKSIPQKTMITEILNVENYPGDSGNIPAPEAVIVFNVDQPRMVFLATLVDQRSTLVLPDCSVKKSENAIRECTRSAIGTALKKYVGIYKRQVVYSRLGSPFQSLETISKKDGTYDLRTLEEFSDGSSSSNESLPADNRRSQSSDPVIVELENRLAELATEKKEAEAEIKKCHESKKGYEREIKAKSFACTKACETKKSGCFELLEATGGGPNSPLVEPDELSCVTVAYYLRRQTREFLETITTPENIRRCSDVAYTCPAVVFWRNLRSCLSKKSDDADLKYIEEKIKKTSRHLEHHLSCPRCPPLEDEDE